MTYLLILRGYLTEYNAVCGCLCAVAVELLVKCSGLMQDLTPARFRASLFVIAVGFLVKYAGWTECFTRNPDALVERIIGH